MSERCERGAPIGKADISDLRAFARGEAPGAKRRSQVSASERPALEGHKQ